MQRYPVAPMSWERAGDAAETGMNELDPGGETPPGPARSGSPNLRNVTGFGLLMSSLLPRADAHAQVMGIAIEGSTATPTPIPPRDSPQASFRIIALESWESVTAFSPADMPGDGTAVAGSDLGFVAHGGGANLSDIEFNEVGGSIRL